MVVSVGTVMSIPYLYWELFLSIKSSLGCCWNHCILCALSKWHLWHFNTGVHKLWVPGCPVWINFRLCGACIWENLWTTALVLWYLRIPTLLQHTPLLRNHLRGVCHHPENTSWDNHDGCRVPWQLYPCPEQCPSCAGRCWTILH